MLTPLSLTLVLLAALLHASWNALLRGGADRAQSMLVMNVTVGIAGILMVAVAGLPSAASAGYVIASGLIHLVYNALLVRMYRRGDLGETYPVARGSSPALVALGASLFAGEWMNAVAAAGIGFVCIGIFMLAAKERLRQMDLPWALTTGVVIATYTVVDGVGVRASGNWAGYIGTMFVFFLAAPLWQLARRRAPIVAMTLPQAAMATTGGLISLLAYGAIIWAMQSSHMGAVSALRETSVVFAALLGVLFLGERMTLRRIIACCTIALGAACVGWTS